VLAAVVTWASYLSYCRAMPSTDDYIAAGLYDPELHATNGRLDLLNWLDEQGFTIDEMVAGLAADSLGALAGDRRLVPGERLTRAVAIDLSGLDEHQFDAIASAFGFVAIQDAPNGEVGFTNDEVEAFVVFGILFSIFSEPEALGLLRVVGSAIGRLADASVSMFLTDVESQLLVDGSSELELAQQVTNAIGLFDGLAARLDPILRRHVLQAIERSRRATISYTERFQYRYAVGFVDLVGFTEISNGMEPRALAAFIRDFEGRAHDVVTAEGARVVKLIGDEVMFAATDPAAACRAAHALMDGFGTELEPVVPRGGLAYGDVLVRGGDYYGSIVNLASRLVDEAVPQELLVTEELADATPDCEFAPAGRRMVKGFADPVAVQSFVA
jgi:class 3 adenylate cyclase